MFDRFLSIYYNLIVKKYGKNLSVYFALNIFLISGCGAVW